MSVEIERKFLVRGDGWRALVRRSEEMEQGYLVAPGGRASVRVRITGAQARLNIKAAVVGPARAEYDYPLPLADARQMLDTLCVGRLRKVRHFVEIDGVVIEVDEFADDNSPLVVAEIELPAVDAPFPRPEWLGEEVTDDARYYNHHLAMHPYRQWGAKA